jgi:transposase-like protein
MNVIRCTHCGGENFVKNGSYNGSQRYRCKKCNRSFSDKIRKFTFADKEKFLQLILNNTGIRKSALILGCSHTLLIKWLRELSSLIKQDLSAVSAALEPDKLPEVIEMDEIYTRVKKGAIKFQYGLLILGGEVKLLRL